jgi:quercetin dioxygenase-like cupin family protein
MNLPPHDANLREQRMNPFDQQRRSCLVTLGALGLSQVLLESMGSAQIAAPQGFVLDATEGEHLVHFRDQGNIFIKLGAATGSANLALGTQQVMKGTGIPVHRHFKMDEVFYVLDGSGIFVLDGVRHSFEEGATIFIPKNSWHEFENPEDELLLLWVVTPAGLDGFFHDTCNPPGMPSKHLTLAEIHEIARKYDTEFR